MVAKISVGNSLYGALAYNGEKINEAKDVYKRQLHRQVGDVKVQRFSSEPVHHLDAEGRERAAVVGFCLLYTSRCV